MKMDYISDIQNYCQKPMNVLGYQLFDDAIQKEDLTFPIVVKDRQDVWPVQLKENEEDEDEDEDGTTDGTTSVTTTEEPSTTPNDTFIAPYSLRREFKHNFIGMDNRDRFRVMWSEGLHHLDEEV